MDIFGVIFRNSIIYKIFMYLLFLYDESYLKNFCDFCVKVYYGSKVYVGVDRYINSTPLYKYSMIKRFNEIIYLFIVNHSEWLYNFVDRTFTNSFFVKLMQKECYKAKDDLFKNITGCIGLFFVGMAFALIFLGKSNVIIIAVCIIILFFMILFAFSEVFKNIFYKSLCYKIADKLLKMEVANETK